jgi:hypothetical protein
VTASVFFLIKKKKDTQQGCSHAHEYRGQGCKTQRPLDGIAAAAVMRTCRGVPSGLGLHKRAAQRNGPPLLFFFFLKTRIEWGCRGAKEQTWHHTSRSDFWCISVLARKPWRKKWPRQQNKKITSKIKHFRVCNHRLSYISLVINLFSILPNQQRARSDFCLILYVVNYGRVGKYNMRKSKRYCA